MYGDDCQLTIVQGCMDETKINYDSNANHDTGTTRCKDGDDVYNLAGYTDRFTRLNKWMAMQQRKYEKQGGRADGKDWSDKKERKEIRRADRIEIKEAHCS